MELHAGQTFVAQDGPYTGQVLTIIGEDPERPGQDRWLFRSLDAKHWGAPGARLREALARERQAEAPAAPGETPAEPAPTGDLPQTEAPAAPLPATPAALPAASPGASAAGTAPPVAPAPPAPALDFAHTPVKILLQLWPDEGNGRTAWLGADLPDHNPIWQPVPREQVEALLALLAGPLGQLEQEFPGRQAKIVAALAAEQRTSSAPPARTTPTPAAHPKPAGRARGTPLTTVPAAAPAAKPTGPSPDHQAYLDSLKQADMFTSPAEATPASTPPA